ncbi:hypothetical protein K438DRAFT_1758795 [Mycena galopus ATCC 62051]|nr:hypothetical protein K438DRAFT_1758795 [Mycena galopus ATCC 62051]
MHKEFFSIDGSDRLLIGSYKPIVTFVHSLYRLDQWWCVSLLLHLLRYLEARWSRKEERTTVPEYRIITFKSTSGVTRDGFNPFDNLTGPSTWRDGHEKFDIVPRQCRIIMHASSELSTDI